MRHRRSIPVARGSGGAAPRRHRAIGAQVAAPRVPLPHRAGTTPWLVLRAPGNLRVLLWLCCCLAGCAGPPRGPEQVASRAGLAAGWVQGQGFRHRIFRNSAFADADRPLHVYLEGDGLPFLTPTRISADPTPRNPLALRLLVRDPAPAVYLGRPCYHGEAHAAGCTPRLWTDARYGERVVASMAAALRRLAGRERPLVLIGYSGGGTLAMLLAPRLGNTVRVVTIAGNLDVAAWTQYHRYTPLGGSLDPATQAPLPANITQLHLAGAGDRRVPPRLLAPVVARQSNAVLVVLPGFDHTCCWEAQWPALLARRPERAKGQGPEWHLRSLLGPQPSALGPPRSAPGA